jgi:two-component system, CAI-1 autoinducer sensor kinase/phosphatase CqsS
MANQAIDMLLALVSTQNLNPQDFRPFYVKDCVDAAIGKIGKHKQGQATISTDIQSDFEVFASREFLIFVLINLIKNSLEALKSQGDGKVVVRVLNDQKGRRIEVQDNGPGIDPKTLPHVFDHFFTTKTRGNNTGVGLTFCRNVMQAFGGNIKCKSVVNDFTVFTLSF